MDTPPAFPGESNLGRRYLAYGLGVLGVLVVVIGAGNVLGRMLTTIVGGYPDRGVWSKCGLFVFAALMTCVVAYVLLMPALWLTRWSNLVERIEPFDVPFRRERAVPIAADPASRPFQSRLLEALRAGEAWLIRVVDRWWRELAGPPEDPGWDGIQQFTSIDYRFYLGTVPWRQKRDYLLAKAGHRRERCGSPERLQLHHKTYKRVGHERYTDLEVLCRRCHAATHGKPVDA